jgi:agmatine deiminase
MPAEWERHEATWISWPHNAADWPGKFAAIPWVFAEMVRRIAPGELVRIVVASAAHEARARRALSRAGVEPSRVEFFRFPSDRGWTRDAGPIFVRAGGRGGRGGELRVLRFRFNAWARYPNWRKDDATPPRAARALGLPLEPAVHRGREVVLEGGSIEVNGRGTLITTEECLLDPAVQVRNPGFTRGDYERVFRDRLGAGHVIWLGRGIAGDDTHGHVDDLCRFVGPGTVVLCDEPDGRDANHAALRENRERLEGVKLPDGSRLEVVPLPLPSPLVFGGVRLPASYANFYVANAAVLVPTFNDPRDRVALGILGELFPDRPVVGIHAVDLVWGFGTLHCLTQQQPAG